MHWVHSCDVDPADVGPHPTGMSMISFRKYDDCPLFVVPVGIDGSVNSSYFYCRLCRKWLNISTTQSNFTKHVTRKHPNLLKAQEQEIELTDDEKRAYGKRFILLNALPFSLVEDPDFRMLCPGLTRKGMSEYAHELSNFLSENLVSYLDSAVKVVLSIDEWSSIANQPYLGIEAHVLFDDHYEVLCIDHKVLINQHNTADILAMCVFETIEEFGLESKYIGFVSDTTPLMPATNAALCQYIESQWFPCFCHIMDLLLQTIVESAYPTIEQMFVHQKTLGHSTVFHNYLIEHEAPVTTLPSYTPTRWFSIFELMDHYVKLKTFIADFLAASNEDFDPDVFDAVADLLNVVATAKRAILDLESESFGTISMVIPYFKLLNKSVHSLDQTTWSDLIELFDVDFNSKYLKRLEDEGLSRTLLTATRLNPKMTCHLSNEQIVSADSIIRESIGTVAPHKEERDDESYGLFLHSSQLNEDDPGEDQLAAFIMAIPNSRHLELEEFWFSHAGDWPELAAYAVATLLPPASSTSVERQFSKAARIQNKSRARLYSKKVSDLVKISCNSEAVRELIE